MDGRNWIKVQFPVFGTTKNTTTTRENYIDAHYINGNLSLDHRKWKEFWILFPPPTHRSKKKTIFERKKKNRHHSNSERGKILHLCDIRIFFFFFFLERNPKKEFKQQTEQNLNRTKIFPVSFRFVSFFVFLGATLIHILLLWIVSLCMCMLVIACFIFIIILFCFVSGSIFFLLLLKNITN